MIILDTDHLTVLLDDRHAKHIQLKSRLAAEGDDLTSTTVISVEEQVRGWLATINRQRDVRRQVPAYLRLVKLFDVLARWEILAFDDSAADEFIRLRKERVRIGTLDLKISAIALVKGARLLSANLSDFEHVPGLHVENWSR